jgi:hypothetical protein
MSFLAGIGDLLKQYSAGGATPASSPAGVLNSLMATLGPRSDLQICRQRSELAPGVPAAIRFGNPSAGRKRESSRH